MKFSPIVLFVYNRLDLTIKTVEALKKNELSNKSELFIFSDGSKNKEDEKKVKAVREYLKQITGFKKVKIFESKKNKGLANSIISGVTKIINKYGKVIVLEDDIVVSKYFLNYMNDALNFYQNEKKVFSISGYNRSEYLMSFPKDYKKDIYFNPRTSSWGWGTWKDRWNSVDWKVKDFENFKHSKKQINEFKKIGPDLPSMLIYWKEGKNDSWAVRFSYACFKQKKINVYPVLSYIKNIGFDKGTHHKKKLRINIYENEVLNKKSNIKFNKNYELNYKLINNYNAIFMNNFKLYVKFIFFIKESIRVFRRVFNFIQLYGFIFFIKYFLYSLFNLNFNHYFYGFLIKTSDFPTIKEIFEIKIFDFQIKKPKIIVDLGSNIGLSAKWFINKYPNAKIICFEPDTKNFEICKKNIKNLKNVEVFNYAIMDLTTNVENTGFSGTNSSVFKKSKFGKLKSLSMKDLIKNFNIKNIDLLKIDIEGSQKELFEGDTIWLNNVSNIFIETHKTKDGFDTNYLVFSELLNNGFYHAGRIYNVDHFSRKT